MWLGKHKTPSIIVEYILVPYAHKTKLSNSHLASLRKMPKKVVIEAFLVEEADEVLDERLAGKILECLKSHPPKIPWMETVKRVTVKSA